MPPSPHICPTVVQCDAPCTLEVGIHKHTVVAAGNHPCFSGDTQVIVKDAGGSPTSIAMREIRTGQFLQCLDSGDDMRVPTSPTWCPVVNWGQAEEKATRQIRISFEKPSGALGSLTVTRTHLIYKLTGADVGAEATSVDTCKCGRSCTAMLQLGHSGCQVALLALAVRGFVAHHVATVAPLNSNQYRTVMMPQ